jgi:hypothetical protein
VQRQLDSIKLFFRTTKKVIEEATDLEKKNNESEYIVFFGKRTWENL